MHTSVIGAGSWGTAISWLVATSGHSTALWVRHEQLAEDIRKTRVNQKYLPNLNLPERRLKVSCDLEEVVRHGRVVFIAVPSFAVREIVSRMKPYLVEGVRIINLAKGVEEITFNTMSEIITEETGTGEVFTLSGPSHAEGVAAGDPTAVILAGEKTKAKPLQEKFSTDLFRIYLSPDIRGVEYCGAIKNIIAVATGIASGLGFGDNTAAALVARGLAEMVRFGSSLGAKKETFFGLAGLGDLVATCTSEFSRNRRFGLKVGQGKEVEDILRDMDMVVEGVRTAKVVEELACEKNISLPITRSINRIIYQNSSPHRELNRLMTREYKEENI